MEMHDDSCTTMRVYTILKIQMAHFMCILSQLKKESWSLNTRIQCLKTL